MDFERFLDVFTALARSMSEIARSILEEVARPYANKPKGIRALATSRRTLGFALNKITRAIEGESS